MSWIKNTVSKLRQHFQKQPTTQTQEKAQSKQQQKNVPQKAEQNAGAKIQNMPADAKKQAAQEGHKLLDNGSDRGVEAKEMPTVSNAPTAASSGNSEPRQSKEIQKDKPVPTYSFRPMDTPKSSGKSKSKNKGRDL